MLNLLKKLRGLLRRERERERTRDWGGFERKSRRREKSGEEMKWGRGLNSLIFTVTVNIVDR